MILLLTGSRGAGTAAAANLMLTACVASEYVCCGGCCAGSAAACVVWWLPSPCGPSPCAVQVVIYDDYTKLSSTSTDTAAGGYGLVLHNVSKVCNAYADQCTDGLVAESCMQRALDALPAAAPTPGRLQAEAQAAAAAAAAARDQRQQNATLAGAISAGAGAFFLLVVLVYLLIRHRRSLRRAGGKTGGALLPVVQPPSSLPSGSLDGPDKSQGGQAEASGAAVGALGLYSGNKGADFLLEQPAAGSGTTRSSQSSRPISQ